MMSCSLQVQIEFELTKQFKWKYIAKFYICEDLHKKTTLQFSDFSFANVLAYVCMNANSIFPWKALMMYTMT